MLKTSITLARFGSSFYTTAMDACPFCLEQSRPYGEVALQNDFAYLLTNSDPVLQASFMIIPHRHVETPFDLNDAEWLALKALMAEAKARLDERRVQGYTVGWNVGGVAGQHVAHVHLHVVGRFADEPLAGKGIRHFFKQPTNRRPGKG